MMAELYGRADGYCRGKGGSMHIADFSVGMLGANGVVAGGIPIAVGAAQGLKMQKSDAIVTCMFGDGAVNRGPFLEGLNWAALFSLPVLFVCEDNGVAAFTPAGSVTAGPGPLARAQAIGVPGASLDGHDVVAVDAPVATAGAPARRVAGNAARSDRMGARRRRGARRAVGAVQGLLRGVRRRARGINPDLGSDHHGRRPRRGARRHAADHRDAHLRLRDVRDGRA